MSNNDFVTIARVVKTQGRRGEVAVEMFSDFPERFEDRRRVFALDQKDQRRELQVEDFWPHKDYMVLKFAGIDSISDAETLLKCEIQVPATERTKLEEGWYVSDLIGCVVFDQAREVGTVADVEFGAGEAPVLLVRQGQTEHMIPLAEQYTKLVDTAAKKIQLHLPEGMLEINAPLSSDEKQRQGNE
ncbi:MAG TPA: ribosome maturation factor RimM [Terriglobales bacterium]|nr:ribosome maturation factor RimM [Terriglobales bacterium]